MKRIKPVVVARSKYRHRHQPPELAPVPAQGLDLYMVFYQILGDPNVYSGVFDTHRQSEAAIDQFEAKFGIGKELKDSKLYNRVVTIQRCYSTLNQEIS